MNQLQIKQQEPQIIIKGNEVTEFNILLESLTHGAAKKLISFINICQSRRVVESQLVQEQSKLNEERMKLIKEREDFAASKTGSDKKMENEKPQ